MKSILNKILFIVSISFVLFSCHKDLDQSPIDPDSFTEQDVFANATEAKGALAKLYAGLALTGQTGPAGDADIDTDIIDEGFSQYTRMMFNLNELTTDHAVVGWGDAGLQDMHGMYWAAGNDFTDAMYYRLAQEVSFCNSFITNAEALNADANVQLYIAEARFLRAYAYYNLMDMYANVPLVTVVSTELPDQSNRQEIFDFVESELLEIQDLLASDGGNEYGRVDKVAAWALLSKLYLNAETWIGTAKYTECITYSNMVMNSSYSINTNDADANGTAYDELFLADNNENGAENEFIFAVNFDGLNSQTYGGSTFLIHAAVGGTMTASDYGINGGWGGIRTTKALPQTFSRGLSTASLNAALGGFASSWGLVGDLNGWSSPDIVMYDLGNSKYGVYVTISSAGGMKFRYDNDWSVNFGDTGANGTLDAGGDNISVNPGVYYVEMDLSTMTYTISMADKRAMFYTSGQEYEIEDIAQFKQGWAVEKFKNIRSDGGAVSDAGGTFTDVDLPLIRLSEIYLNYAEAVKRGGSGGSLTTAKDKINLLRERAFGTAGGNVAEGDITLSFILDERSRELYWEGQRRTDLVRYDLFTTSDYMWPFKGNAADGTSVGDYRNVFPLPTNALSANPNLTQNTGY